MYPQVGGRMPLLAVVLILSTVYARMPVSAIEVPPITAANSSTNSANSTTSGLQAMSLLGYAEDCKPPRLAGWPMSVPVVPAMSSSGKDPGRPNFIVILVDDQGFDDIGLHHPRGPDGKTSAGAQTPNMDNLIKRGASFTNFYTGPLCATTRAQLLTGRDYPRTGNLYNARGFDSFALGEATAGDVMKQAGYKTAHFGKWHNGNTAGYESWNRGFELGVIPSPYVHVDNLMRVNGQYQQTKGLMEQVLLDKLLGYVKEREEDNQPFFVYYAPYSIHGVPRGSIFNNATDKDFDYEPYLSKILAIDPTIHEKTAHLWAKLMYIDDVLGRLFDYINNSTLKSSTYIMLTSDNGGAVSSDVLKNAVERLRRMPSGMLGSKNQNEPSLRSTGAEGGIRNHLAVVGPGVPAGLVDDTLLSVSDILPTVAEMGGAVNTKHLPWSGISFANLLKPGGEPTEQQKERFVFTLTTCPHLENVMKRVLLDLRPDRRVVKSQPNLMYANATGSGIKPCIVGRFKEFKWFGSTNRIFRLVNDSHIERPCNDVMNATAKDLLWKRFNTEAYKWWNQVLAEPHSFEKAVYQLGANRWRASNVEAVGAVEVIGSNVYLNSDAAVNFTQRGDGICANVNVVRSGRYKVVAAYGARLPTSYKLAVGSREDIKKARVPTLAGRLPYTRKLVPKSLGVLPLNSTRGQVTNACFRLVEVELNATDPELDVENEIPSLRLFNIRFVLLGDNGTINSKIGPGGLNLTAPTDSSSSNSSSVAVAAAGGQSLTKQQAVDVAAAAVVPAGLPSADQVALSVQVEPAKYTHLKPTADMKELERRIRAVTAAQQAADKHGPVPTLASMLLGNEEQQATVDPKVAAPAPGSSSINSGSNSNSGSSSSSSSRSSLLAKELQVWQYLKQRYLWPDGQVVFDSMYSPWDVEGELSPI